MALEKDSTPETTVNTTSDSENETLLLEPENSGVSYSTLLVCCHNIVMARVPLLSSLALQNMANMVLPVLSSPDLFYLKIEGLFYLAPHFVAPMVSDFTSHDKSLTLTLAALQYGTYDESPALSISLYHSGLGFFATLNNPLVLAFSPQNKTLVLTLAALQHSTHNKALALSLAALQHSPHVQIPVLASALAYVPITNYEDFSTYTEVDPNNHLTKTATRVTGYLLRGETAYVYKDKGVNHFSGNFTHKFTIKTHTTIPSGNTGANFWGISNTLAGGQSLGNHAITVLHYADLIYTLYLHILGVGYSAWITLSANTVYYCTVTRVGNVVTLYVYNNAARTSLKGSATKTDTSPISARYIFGLISDDTNQGEPPTDIYVENLMLA